MGITQSSPRLGWEELRCRLIHARTVATGACVCAECGSLGYHDETVAILLRSNKAKDGVAAFFLDMQKQAKTTASIIYDALNSAFNKLSDNLTELITGGKTNFAAMFQDIGKQILNSTIRQGLQKGLGALGAK